LSELSDPTTRELCSMLGIGSGWRCLDVGAGAGSVAAWMANAVGDSGGVVAADLDTSRLGFLTEMKVDVREHDILAGPVDGDSFDLVHCRALLMHLPDPQRALEHMAASVRAGGWLLVEDVDFGLWGTADNRHPEAEWFTDRSQSLFTSLDDLGIINAYLGRSLFGMVNRLDLVETGCKGSFEVLRGGSQGARFWGLTERTTNGPLVEAGLIDAGDATRRAELYADSTFAFIPTVRVAAWGQRPDGP
jgi:SAM-dependent methyltransferase